MNEYDAIIIGSGAGGAPLAHELIRAGKSVLVLEKGPLMRTQRQDPRGRSDFKRDEFLANGPEKRIMVAGVANTGQSYFPSHVEPDLTDEPHIYRDHDGSDRVTMEGYTAQVVGGGTQLYGGVSLRYHPLDFRLASFNADRQLPADPHDDIRREDRDWPLQYADLEPYYGKAERLIGMLGTAENQDKPFSGSFYQRPHLANGIGRYVELGMDRLGMKRYRTPLAVITEPHAPSGRQAGNPMTGFVNRYGDPLGFKSNTWVSLLAPVHDLPNFTLRCNCVVTHLESQGARVAAVHYRDESGLPQVARARLVAVACSAIESVRLLQLSASYDPEGFGRRLHHNDLVGKYFLTHTMGGAETRVPERFDKSVSLDSEWATDHCARAEFLEEHGLWAGAVIYNNTSDQAMPLSLVRHDASGDMDTVWDAVTKGYRDWDRDVLGEFLDEDFGRRLSVSFMANQVPVRENRIELHPRVRDKWGRPVAYIIKSWHAHDCFLMDVLAEQCAAILREGVGPEAQAHMEQGGVHMALNSAARIANHILGGARFGHDPSDSVLDPDCRAWEFDNLYVTDGAFMPTSGGANPTLTIQANSFRVADRWLARL